MDLGLSGRAAIVTGASRGIGLATARLLVAEGANLLLCARDSEALARAGETVAETGRDAGARVMSAALDITEPDAAERLVAACRERFGSVDALVNNAGASRNVPLAEIPDEEWHGQYEINVLAPMRLMRAAAPAMAQRGWGRIVNVCSSSGKRPSPTNAAYGVTKAAELALSRAYAEEWAARGVLVNAVAPGPVAGSMWLAPGGLADQAAQAKGVSRDEALEAAAAKLPRGRLASEEEIAAVICFLCSEAAANVVGSAWSVDGGAVATIV